MTKHPKISVLLPVYNGERYLGEAIKSILGQDFNDFELLIIDDGSTDGSYGIIRNFSDRRIRLVQNKKNIGLSASLNRGLREAKGKYVARMDDDDIALPSRLRLQSEFLDAHPEIFLLGSRSMIIDSGGHPIRSPHILTGPERIKACLPKGNCFFHSSIMFRKEAVSYREKLYFVEDYDLYLRLVSEGKKLANLGAVLMEYRHNEKSISRARQVEQMHFADKAREFYLERLRRGYDSYDAFSPDDFLGEASKRPHDKITLKRLIATSFSMLDTAKARRWMVEYRSRYGSFNGYTLILPFTFLPKVILAPFIGLFSFIRTL